MPNDDFFEDLVPPWEDWGVLAENEVIARMEQQARAAAAHDDAVPAAMGLVVAVGNYEFAGPARQSVLDAANALLGEIDPERSKSW